MADSSPENGRRLSEVAKAAFRGKSDNILVQLFRYFGSSGVAFVVDLSLLYIITEWFGVHYLISNIIASVTAMVSNYLLSVLWVFSRRSINNRTAEFTIFMLTGVAGLGLNQLLLWLFTDIVGIYYMISKFFAAVIGYLSKFFVRRNLLFR
jgi:putative flippase GtrA